MIESGAPRRPKVLILTPRYPYPVIGGDRLRIYHICKELAQTCSLTLLSLCESRAEMAMSIPADNVFDRVERVFLPKWRSFLNVLMALPGHTPLQVAYYRSSEYRQRVQLLLRDHDICLAHLIRTGHYIRDAHLPRVLEMTDAISLNYRRVKALANKQSLKSYIYSIEAKRLEAYEREIISHFDATTLVSAVDRDFLLRGQNNSRVVVCSNGVDLSNFPYREPQSCAPVVVFIGNMTTLQNLDACQYFINEVLPLLRKHMGFRFRIIGRISTTDAVRLSSYEGVEVMANVDSVAEAVGDAYAAVAPMRLGAGVQNKILEYMALGVPAVTSRVGLEGLHAEADDEILVADTPNEWVTHLLSLWMKSDYALALARAGRDYVTREHSWSAQLAPLTATIHKAAKRPPSTERHQIDMRAA